MSFDPLALARPLWLGAPGREFLAWWHAPASSASSPSTAPVAGLAVVIAGSWGDEDLAAYDGLRRLAQSLAARGIGCLRFDWPDGGDSAAVAASCASVDLALAAFDAAADAARALSRSTSGAVVGGALGGTRLAFVGLRLGALFAAHAALTRRDVQALVGLLPVASGRAFLRQGLLRSRAAGSMPEPAPRPGAVPPGDSDLDAQAADRLNALKWPGTDSGAQASTGIDAQGPALRHALLFESADPAGLQAGAEALERMGACVETRHCDELAPLLAIAHRAYFATAPLQEIVDWLAGLAAAGPTQVESAPPVAPALPSWRDTLRIEVDGRPVDERLCFVEAPPGQAGSPLFGVLSLPGRLDGGRGMDSAEDRGVSAPRGLLLLSSGRERRIGPHRLWVPFARRRAAHGDVVLRMDLPGIGDSPARLPEEARAGQAPLYDSRHPPDVARAVEWLHTACGVRECVVLGLCSGGYQAWRAALAGADLRQVIVINPLVFHWKAGMSLDSPSLAPGQIRIVADAWRSLASPRQWLKLLRGKVRVRVILAACLARGRGVVRSGLREWARRAGWPLADDLAADLAQLCQRGVRPDFVFSRGEPGRTLLIEESGRTGRRLRRDKRFGLHTLNRADHTFSTDAGRAALYDHLDTLLDAGRPEARKPHPAPARPFPAPSPRPPSE